jgi:hypothetical protein
MFGGLVVYSFGRVRRFTRIGLNHATDLNSLNSPAKGYISHIYMNTKFLIEIR